MNTKVVNNVVPIEKLRKIEQSTLNDLANYLKNSFGPFGSTTAIKKLNALTEYTKDGHKILSSISYNGIIEQSIKDDVECITRHIVKTVGDGTTSAVILANGIFRYLCDNDELSGIAPSILLNYFHEVVDDICNKIKENRKECTVESIYDIAMISSNGNSKIADNLAEIYRQYGMGVFIDVGVSNSTNDVLKVYDGVTFEAGFADPCYINNTEHNTSTIRNAHIYYFQDPIDTPEMGAFLDSIIANNILIPLNKGNKDCELRPTVVICPKVSRDVSSTLDSLMEQYMKAKPSQRPPFVLVSGYSDFQTIEDIMKLCAGKTIRKYIDPNMQSKDIETGNAPDIKTIVNWCGTADEVVVSSTYTKFINPSAMFDENGEYSNIYNSLVEFLEKELEVAQENGENAGVTGNLKRRINSLKANMVEYLVGGISIADRDSERDLVEDAVKNCRSAAENGVGYGANFEGLNATGKLTYEDNHIKELIRQIIYDSYNEVIYTLFEVSGGNTHDADKCIEAGVPVNIRAIVYGDTEFGGNVYSSIESDIIILTAVSEIIGIMFTTNQFIVPSPAHNFYVDF